MSLMPLLILVFTVMYLVHFIEVKREYKKRQKQIAIKKELRRYRGR